MTDNALAGEQWLPAPGFEDLYEVSSHGRVRPIRVLGTLRNEHGYVTVRLRKDGRKIHKTVHGLVCRAFHGQAPKGHEVGHRDGDQTNNRADNLRWVTHAQNYEDMRAHGRNPAGERHGLARLSLVDVQHIRQAKGKTLTELAAQFGVGPQHISKIRRGDRWKDE